MDGLVPLSGHAHTELTFDWGPRRSTKTTAFASDGTPARPAMFTVDAALPSVIGDAPANALRLSGVNDPPAPSVLMYPTTEARSATLPLAF